MHGCGNGELAAWHYYTRRVAMLICVLAEQWQQMHGQCRALFMEFSA